MESGLDILCHSNFYKEPMFPISHNCNGKTYQWTCKSCARQQSLSLAGTSLSQPQPSCWSPSAHQIEKVFPLRLPFQFSVNGSWTAHNHPTSICLALAEELQVKASVSVINPRHWFKQWVWGYLQFLSYWAPIRDCRDLLRLASNSSSGNNQVSW